MDPLCFHCALTVCDIAIGSDRRDYHQCPVIARLASYTVGSVRSLHPKFRVSEDKSITILAQDSFALPSQRKKLSVGVHFVTEQCLSCRCRLWLHLPFSVRERYRCATTTASIVGCRCGLVPLPECNLNVNLNVNVNVNANSPYVW